jgi:hypothetical protein
MFDIDNCFVCIYGLLLFEFGFVRLVDFLDYAIQKLKVIKFILKSNPKNPQIQRIQIQTKKTHNNPYRKTPSKNASTSSFVGCFTGRTTLKPTKGESAFHHLLLGI